MIKQKQKKDEIILKLGGIENAIHGLINILCVRASIELAESTAIAECDKIKIEDKIHNIENGVVY